MTPEDLFGPAGRFAVDLEGHVDAAVANEIRGIETEAGGPMEEILRAAMRMGAEVGARTTLEYLASRLEGS